MNSYNKHVTGKKIKLQLKRSFAKLTSRYLFDYNVWRKDEDEQWYTLMGVKKSILTQNRLLFNCGALPYFFIEKFKIDQPGFVAVKWLKNRKTHILVYYDHKLIFWHQYDQFNKAQLERDLREFQIGRELEFFKPEELNFHDERIHFFAEKRALAA
jgi:hypothetical protein